MPPPPLNWRIPATPAVHLLAALDSFLLQLRADGRSPHTAGQYRRHVQALADWLRAERRPLAVARVDAETLARFLASPTALVRADGRPKRPTSVNALRTSLRCFFAYLRDAGAVGSNPARLLRRARCVPPPPRPLPEDDMRRLLRALDAGATAADRRDRALLVLLAESGIRLGSALGLDATDVNMVLGEATARAAKGGAELRVVLPPRACDVLREYLGSRRGGLLFPGANGAPLSRRQAQRRFAVWLRRAGVERPTTLHALRHRFATRLYSRTGDVLLVKQALGHRSIASTMVYVDADQGRLRAALGR